MRILITETKRGAKKGKIYPDLFVKDVEYELDEVEESSLLSQLLDNGWAVPVEDKKSGGTKDISDMTRKELLVFIKDKNLDIDPDQKVEDLKTAIKTQLGV